MARKIKRKSVKVEFKTPSKTIQSESDRADINRIVKRGIVPPDPETMQYGDFTSGDDFQTMQDRIVIVRRSFDRLTAEDRAYFANDPKNMLDFMSDPNPEKQQIAADMGLRPQPEIENEPVKKSKNTPDPTNTDPDKSGDNPVSDDPK